MTGIVKLGAPGALRDYNLLQQGEGIAWETGPANPFAAKVNSSSQYDEVDDWNEYIQEDWQTGVGRVDPQAGGFLYAEAETRVPSQVILPPLVQLLDSRVIDGTTADCRYMPDNAAGTITVGSGSHVRVAMSFTTPGTVNGSTMGYFFYARIANGVSVTLSTYTNSGGSPGTLINSTTVTGTNPDRNFHWYGNNINHGSLTTSTQYWVTIEPTSGSDTIEVVYGSSGYNTVAKSYNGSAWAAIASSYIFFMVDVHQLYNSASDDRRLIRFNGNLYTCMDESLYKLNVANNNFTSVGTVTGSGDITSVAVYGPTLYFGRSSGNYTTMDTAEAFSAAATTATLFLEAGLFYRSYQNDLYYLDDDGVTWVGPFVFGSDAYEIRGMAQMGDSLFVATDRSLWRFAPGNVVEWVSDFGAIESTNGVGMLEYQGRLYIPAGGRLFRFDPSGQLMDIWVSREDDLPSARIGTIASLAHMNNWLIAFVVPTSGSIMATLWVFQEEGWHFLAGTRQTNVTLDAARFRVFYDRATTRLYFTVGRGTHYVEIEDYTLNPFNSSTYLYQPFGWLEQDKFYGGQLSLNKDWESVRIYGENLSTNVHVKVYFQDEGSTAWELLGTVDSDGEELRWSDYTTRPSGKWIKLGLLLQTNDGDETPRIRAVVVKFLPKTNQKIQDNITIMLKSNIEGPDGTTDAYTHDQQWAHIKSLIKDRVHPVIYMNPEGVYYETYIVSHRRRGIIFAREGGSNLVKESHISLTLRQVNDSEYTP